MAWRHLTEAQWEQIRPPLPVAKRSSQGGRPPADVRCCFEGILWILWTGAPWSELPKRYGSPRTCWRRLREWEATGVLLTLWRAFLAQLNDRQQLRWNECFVDGSVAPAKKGAQSRTDQARQGHKVEGLGRWRGSSAGNIPGVGVPGGSPAPRSDPRHRRGDPPAPARASPQAARPADCRPGL